MTRTRSRLFGIRIVPRLETLEARDLPSFTKPVTFFAGPSGTPENDLVIADVNGDGRRDLAVSLHWSNAVSVLLGDGTGSLSSPSYFPTDTRPSGVEAGDLNLDGKSDIVTANYGNGSVSVLLGNGNGTFLPHLDRYAGLQPLGVAIGDLDGDGKPDVGTADYGSAKAAVLLGNGDGSLKFPAFHPSGELPIGAEIADLDGDGIGDLTVGSYYGDDVRVYLSSGVTTSYFMGKGTWGHTLADVNKDGFTDLVVAQKVGFGVSVLLNHGDGSFGPKVNYRTRGALYPAVADFNQDGNPDIAVFGGWHVRLLLGKGDGTFRPDIDVETGLGDFSFHSTVGDLNNDRYPDIVVSGSNHDSISLLAVLLNDRNWSVPVPPIESEIVSPTPIAPTSFPIPLAEKQLPRLGTDDVAVLPETKTIPATPANLPSRRVSAVDVTMPVIFAFDDLANALR